MNQFFSNSDSHNMDGIAIAESLLYRDSEDIKAMMRMNNIPLGEFSQLSASSADSGGGNTVSHDLDTGSQTPLSGSESLVAGSWSENNSNANMNDFVNKLIQSQEDIPREIANLSLSGSNLSGNVNPNQQHIPIHRSGSRGLLVPQSPSQQLQNTSSHAHFQSSQLNSQQRQSSLISSYRGQQNLNKGSSNTIDLVCGQQDHGTGLLNSPRRQQLIHQISDSNQPRGGSNILSRCHSLETGYSTSQHTDWVSLGPMDDLALGSSGMNSNLLHNTNSSSWTFRPIRSHMDSMVATTSTSLLANSAGTRVAGIRLVTPCSSPRTPPPVSDVQNQSSAASHFQLGRPSPLPRPLRPSPINFIAAGQHHQAPSPIQLQQQSPQTPVRTQHLGWTRAASPHPPLTGGSCNQNEGYLVSHTNDPRVYTTLECTTVNSTSGADSVGPNPSQGPSGYLFIPAGYLSTQQQQQQQTPNSGSGPASIVTGRSSQPAINTNPANPTQDLNASQQNIAGALTSAAVLSQQQQQRLINKRTQASMEFQTKFEILVEQHRFLENERKKTESDLTRQNPGKKISHINNVSVAKSSNNASRVDKELNAILANHARVVNLISKMEKLRNELLPSNINSAMECWLEGIRKCQARRKEEMVNATNRQRSGGPRHQDDKDLLALAAALSELSEHMRRARTALWAAMQMTDKDRASTAQQALNYLAQLAAQSYRANQKLKTIVPSTGGSILTNQPTSSSFITTGPMIHGARGGKVLFAGAPTHYQLAPPPSATLYNMYYTPATSSSPAGFHHV